METRLKRIVVSGVNLVEAGPLAVFKDALGELTKHFADSYEIIALVHRADLFEPGKVRYIEFPHVKQSWLRRCKFEYWDCRALSRDLDAYLWLAMHDFTPNVRATKRAVYYHNPSPFSRAGLREAWADKRLTLFRLFYPILFAINVRRNNFVVVQQQWLRAAIVKIFPGLPLVVSHPSMPPMDLLAGHDIDRGASFKFFYPAYPRSFKNVEVLLEACEVLEATGAAEFEVWLTISGTENAYAAGLLQRFGKLSCVRWMGALPRERVLELYNKCDCLVFASRLETWGMPILEFKSTGKPMLLAELPYAHETLGSYPAASFFAPEDARELAAQMLAVLRGTLVFQPHAATAVAEPFARDWQALFRLLLGEDAA